MDARHGNSIKARAIVKVKISVWGLVRVVVSASVRVRVRVRFRVEALVGRRVKEAERLWFLGILWGPQLTRFKCW